MRLNTMQNKARGAVLALMMTSLLAAPIAEAKRAGGGKSSGMSRQSSSQSYQQNTTQRTTTPPTQVAPQQQKSGSNVGSMVAAGVAGAAIGAVAANAMADDNTSTASNPGSNPNNTTAAQEESGGMGWLWILVLAAIAFFVFRKFKAKKPATANPYAPNNTGNGFGKQNQAPFGQPSTPTAGNNTNIFGQPVGGQTPTAPVGGFGGAYTNSGQQLPDGTEPATFLRFARQRFNHIQAMNTASNIEEIRRYFTPDLYQEIHQDIANNHDVAEFSNLLANVVEHSTESGQHIVSVRFTGMVSEDINSPSQPFAEIWHFVKPQGSQDEWIVAGIQQTN